MLSMPRYRGRIMELEPVEAPLAVAPVAIQPATAQVPTDVEPIVAGAPAVSPLDADLLRQVPARLGTEIVALQAEDHYVRVYTLLGSALVRYRFKDAMDELAPLGGRRVHRSFWVRDCYAEHTGATGDLFEIVMSTGLRVPVSRAYRSAARSIGHDPSLSRI